MSSQQPKPNESHPWYRLFIGFGILFAVALTVVLVLFIVKGGAWYWWLLVIGGISFSADTIRMWRNIDHLNTWLKSAPSLDKFRFYSLVFYGMAMMLILIWIIYVGPARVAAMLGI